MRFFKRKTAYPPKRTEDTARLWKTACRAYEAHLESILPKLPAGAQLLARTEFHDARITRIDRPSKSTLVFTLSGGYALSGETTLTFVGVNQCWVPDTVRGQEILFDEVDLSELT